MAYDPDFIEKVGIYYETHDESPEEVSKLFNIKSKQTLYNWIEKNGWIQNKYRSLQQSAGGLIEQSTLNAIRDGAVDAVVGEVMALDQHSGHSDIARASKVAASVVRDVLTQQDINEEASVILRDMLSLAKVSNRISDKRTALEGIKTAKEIIFGKNPDVVFVGDSSKLSEMDYASMSEEELIRIAMQKYEKGG